MWDLTGSRPWVRPLAVLALGAAAYLTNLWPLPLSFGLHFLFGGLFAMLAAMLFGPWAGAAAALLSALPTIGLWGHSFALLSMTLEAWVVGLEARRGKAHPTATDLVYWLLIGVPLVTITYSLGAQIPFMASLVAGLKQAVNGLVYTSVASVLVLILGQRRGRPLPLEVVLSNFLTMLVVVPLAFSVAWVTQESGAQQRAQLSSEAVRTGAVVSAAIRQEVAAQGDRLDVNLLDRRLGDLVQAMGLEIVVTDQSETVVFSTWTGVAAGSPFVSDQGEAAFFHAVADRTSLAQAEQVAFVHREEMADLGWRVYVRRPLGAVEYVLYQSYRRSFLTALSLMVILLGAIRFVSYAVTRPLVALAELTVTPEGEMVNLPSAEPSWVAEVQAVTQHLERVRRRIRGLVHSLHETQRELQRHNVELAVANIHLADEAERDALTGLRNQRALWQQIQLWVEEMHPFTLVVADLGGLQHLVERQGHLAGEEVVKAVAAELQHHATMHGGEVYQYGAERFVALFPESSEWLVERMLLTLPAMAGPLCEGVALAVGAARFPEEGETGPTVFHLADRRLQHG